MLAGRSEGICSIEGDIDDVDDVVCSVVTGLDEDSPGGGGGGGGGIGGGVRCK